MKVSSAAILLGSFGVKLLQIATFSQNITVLLDLTLNVKHNLRTIFIAEDLVVFSDLLKLVKPKGVLKLHNLFFTIMRALHSFEWKRIVIFWQSICQFLQERGF